MAKKTLLSEGNIRKFMKLAAIEPLTENFLAEVEEEEEVGEMEGDTEGDMEDDMEGEEEEVGEMEDDMEGDMEDDDMGDEEEAGGEEAIKAALESLISAIKAAPDTDVTIDEGMGEEEEGDYMTEEDEDLYEELNESVKVVDTQAVVKEVSRRVAQRLIKESKQEKLAEALARKIAARLR